MTATATSAPTAAAELVRPFWRQARWWLVGAAVVLLGAILIGTLAGNPGRPLDPDSAQPGGSRALAHVLAGYGTRVHRTTSLATARDAADPVVVTSPDDYSARQLRDLAGQAPLVLVRPGTRATAAVAPAATPDPDAAVSDVPSCSAPSATAAGRIAMPADAVVYRDPGAVSCYGGAVLITRRLVLLGSADLLRNDVLARSGVAALDVNLISADRSARAVTWLLPGADAAGPGPASIWDLFPGGAYRVYLWLAALAVLVVLWRARRLGGVVREPLPVVVRAAELVEGHGRLYQRAGARDRAAQALRDGAAHRLGARFAMPPGTPIDQVAIMVAGLLHRPPAQVVALLAGPPPGDDDALVGLARDLDALEAAVGGDTARER